MKKTKFEEFRMWVINQGEYDCWTCDADVLAIIEANPQGKFKAYLHELKSIMIINTEAMTMETVKEVESKETVEVDAVLNPQGLEQEITAAGLDGAFQNDVHSKRIGKTIIAQLHLQSQIVNGNAVNRYAASVVCSSTNWASNNPKTAVAVGVTTLAIAGVGLYHLGKIAKQHF